VPQGCGICMVGEKGAGMAAKGLVSWIADFLGHTDIGLTLCWFLGVVLVGALLAAWFALRRWVRSRVGPAAWARIQRGHPPGEV